MSYRSDLECMSSHMDVSKTSNGLWFHLKCHECDRRMICRRTLAKYAEIINEDEKIRDAVAAAKTIGSVLVRTARSIGH